MRNFGLFAAAAVLTLALAFVPARAGAAGGVTFTSTQTLPVPPASDYAGQGGGDGWAIALRPDAGAGHPAEVFNVFHHDQTLTVACHLQKDATPCWDPITLDNIQTDYDFQSSGQSSVYVDQQTAKLYSFTTARNVVGDKTLYTAGVVCFDTLAAETS